MALLEEAGSRERLAVLVEGESLLNDGVSVVTFSTLLAVTTTAQQQGSLTGVLSPTMVGELVVEITVVSLGGALVGLAAGYAVCRILLNLNKLMTKLVPTSSWPTGVSR